MKYYIDTGVFHRVHGGAGTCLELRIPLRKPISHTWVLGLRPGSISEIASCKCTLRDTAGDFQVFVLHHPCGRPGMNSRLLVTA